MAKNFQVVLDFLVNLKSDKSQVERLAKEVETILSKVSPDLDFDSTEFKNGIKQVVQFLMEAEEGAKDLEKVLSALEIDLDTEEAKKALSDIESILIDIDKTDLSEIEKTLNELQQGNLDENIQNLDKALKEMDATKFDKEVEKLAESFLRARQETEQLVAKQKLALQALKASGNEGSEAYNKLQKEISEAEAKLVQLDSTSKNTKTIGDRMATFGMAVQGIEQLTSTLNSFQEPFIELDKQVRNIGTLGVKNFQEFASAATNLSTTVPDSAGEIAQGVYDAISAGTIKVKDGFADVTEGMVFVETASKLATAGLTSTQDAVNGLTSVMNAYGIEAGRSSEVADIFFGAVNVGKTTIPELNASLANVIPTAAAFEVEFKQVAAAIATMTKQGTPTAQATTQIRAALTELAKPGATLAPIMQKAGVSLDSLKKDGLQESLKKIGGAIEDAGKSATQIFSSVEAAGAVMLLSGKNAQMAADDYIAVANSIGTTEEAFKVASEGIGVKTKIMLNSIQAGFNNLMETIGSTGQTVLSASTQLAPLITSFAGLGQIIPVDKIKGQISGISSGFTSLIKNAESTGGVIKGLSSKMQESSGILAKLGPAIANPWVLGIGAAVAGLTLYLTKTEKGKQILERWGDSAKELWNKAQPVIDSFLDAGEEFINYLIKIGEFVFEMLITPIEIAISFVSEIVNAIIDLVGVSNESSNAFQNLGEALKLIGKYFEMTAKGVQVLIYSVRIAKDFVLGFIESIPELFSVLMDYAKYYLNPVNWISGDDEYEKELSNRLTNAVSGAMNKAKNTIAESKLDFAIQNAMTIKEEIDKNKKIDELVKKFESAKSEIEKKSIAEEIAKQVPGAVNGYKQLIDENGKVVQAIDLNIEKVKEFTKANEESYSSKLKSEQNTFTEALKEKADLYQNLSVQVETLANKIVEGSKKGEDVSEIKAKYQKVKEELKSQTEEMSKTLAEGSKIGIEFDKVELRSEVEEQFNVQLIELRNKVKDTKFGEAVTEMISIQKNLDEQDNIGKLVEKFSKAKTEIEKASIAEQIKRTAPEAVKEIGVIQDKEGKLIKQYDIQSEKILEVSEKMKERYSSELQSKQEAYLGNLKKEEDAYKSGQTKLKELQDEINKSKEKGLDTKELEKSYNAIQQKMNAQKDGIIDWAGKAIQGGIDANRVYEQIAKSFGISVEEAKNLVNVQKESKSVGESQVKVIDKLAEAWSAATSEIDNNIKTQLSAINEMSKQLKNKALSKEEQKELQEQYNSELKSLKENVKEKKNLDRIDETNQIRAGLKTKEGKSAFELAKQESELKNKNLEIDQKNYEYVQKQSLIQENRKADSYDELLINQKQLETIKNQRIAWIEALKAKKLISEVTNEGEIIFNSKVKEADKTEIKSIIQDFNIKVQEEQSKILELKVKLKADDIALKDKLSDLEKKKIEWEISIGIKEETALETYIDEYRNKLSITRNEIETNNDVIVKLNQDLENELSRVSGENSVQETERIRIRYELKIKEAKEKNLELIQNELDTQQKIIDIEDKIYKSRVDSIKRSEDEKLSEIENRFKRESEILNKFNEIYNRATDKSLSEDKDSELKKIEDTEKAKLAELEKWRDMNSISSEVFEKKKAEIEENGRKEREKKEEEFRRKQLRADSQRQGLELELQRRKDNETLSIQKDALKKQLELLEEKANKFDLFGRPIFDSQKEQEEYDALSKKLLETEKLISERGDSLGLLVTELQTTVTDSLSNLFAGDPEAAADSWRKFFSQLAGMLQAKASAFILDLVLSPGTMQYISALPFPANVVAIPVITTAINAAVKAITDPIISTILSFSTGGRIDQPTMAIIGDGSRLGGRNREWIFNDSQLIATVQMAGANSNSMLIAKLDRVEKLLASQELKTTLRGNDIDIALRRTNIHNLSRKK
ncbi:MAG: phage tail tape measure protein [Candidatus Kapabacteria bacterium]|nr:phage tail tape measure protein [Candidatus Kapabacteria bacterium]